MPFRGTSEVSVRGSYHPLPHHRRNSDRTKVGACWNIISLYRGRDNGLYPHIVACALKTLLDTIAQWTPKFRNGFQTLNEILKFPVTHTPFLPMGSTTPATVRVAV